jgi:hypothetical protein
MSFLLTSFQKFFTNKQGKVVVWQSPNLPVVVWFIATVLSHLFATGRPHAVLGLISFGALFTWAWLEIFQGSSYFRRLLGLVVLIYSIINRL